VNILTFRDHQISQRSDGYVNLTQVAKANDVRLDNYFRLEETQKYLKAAQDSIYLECEGNAELLQAAGFGKDKATWGHPLVALHFAQWISPDFHVWCNRHIKTLIEQVTPVREVKSTQICPVNKTLDLSGLTSGQLKRLFYFRSSIEDIVGPIDGLVYDIDPTLWAADITSISLAFEQLCLDLEERTLESRKRELAETKRAIRLRKKDIANLQGGKVSRLFPDFGRHYEKPVFESDSLWMIEADR
jgi:KilA-N domain